MYARVVTSKYAGKLVVGSHRNGVLYSIAAFFLLLLLLLLDLSNNATLACARVFFATAIEDDSRGAPRRTQVWGSLVDRFEIQQNSPADHLAQFRARNRRWYSMSLFRLTNSYKRLFSDASKSSRFLHSLPSHRYDVIYDVPYMCKHVHTCMYMYYRQRGAPNNVTMISFAI